MSNQERKRRAARRFLEVVPPLLHRLGSDLREMDVDGTVTLQQFRIMVTLRHCPNSPSGLAALHEVSVPAVSRLVGTLVERGWVQRETDADDRRQLLLKLTEEGQAMCSLIAERGAEHLSELLAQLDEAELAGLEQALDGLGRVVAARRASFEADRPQDESEFNR